MNQSGAILLFLIACPLSAFAQDGAGDAAAELGKLWTNLADDARKKGDHLSAAHYAARAAGAFERIGDARAVEAIAKSRVDRHAVRATIQHENVTAAFFLPGNRAFATAGGDGFLRVWDGQTGKPLRSFQTHSPQRMRTFPSPDGRRIFVHDAGLRAFDIETGKLLFEWPEEFDSWGTEHRFIDGSKRLLINCVSNKNLQLSYWNLETFQLIWKNDTPNGYRKLEVSRDESTGSVVTGHDRLVFDVKSGRKIASFGNYDEGFWSALAPDGKSRYLTHEYIENQQPRDGLIHRDFATGKTTAFPQSLGIPINDGAFSPDGKLLLTLDRQGNARIWNVASKTLVHTLFDANISGARFSRDSSKILTTHRRPRTSVFDATTGKRIDEYPASMRAGFSPTEKFVLLIQGSYNFRTPRRLVDIRFLQIWNQPYQGPLDIVPIATNQFQRVGDMTEAAIVADDDRSMLAILDGPSGLIQIRDMPSKIAAEFAPPALEKKPLPMPGIRGVALHPQQKELLAWGPREVRLLSLPALETVKSFVHGDDLRGAAFNAEGSRILTWSPRAVKVWNRGDGKELFALHPEAALRGALFADKRIATWDEDYGIHIWKEGQDKPVHHFEHQRDVFGVALLPGDRAVSWSADGVCSIWNLETGRSLHLLKPGGIVTAVDAIGPARLWIAAGSGLSEWNIDTGEKLRTIEMPISQIVQLAPSGKQALLSGPSGGIFRMNLEKPPPGKLPYWSGIPATGPGPSFSPDESRALTYGNGRAALHDVASGVTLREFWHGKSLNGAAFVGGGKKVATWGDDAFIVWDADLAPLADARRNLLELEVGTGTTLDERAKLIVLDGETWRRKKSELESGPSAVK